MTKLTRCLVAIAAAQIAAAAAPAPSFRLTPADATGLPGKVIAGDVIWKKAGDSYVASKASSRPAIVCAQAAKKIGKFARFEANGEAFDAEALAICNRKAR